MAKILLIDDDELFRQYVATLLERSGFQVRQLADATSLSEVLEANGFDAIVTDLFMPEVDGIEVVIKAKRTRPGLPIIGVTGARSDDPCIVAMIRLGAAGVLHKPIDEHELLILLKRVLDLEQP
jgi:DNA-binding NtrC family response regulator